MTNLWLKLHDFCVSFFRIDHYVKALADKDSLITKITSLEQMLSNEKIQREELNTYLSKTFTRANEVYLYNLFYFR